jgi:hypothetical protein
VNLEPELIPEPLWHISAARLLGRKSKAWRHIRSDALAEAGGACAVCSEAPPDGKYMVCDELWSYEEQQGVATLAGVRILCPACDHARHFARAGQLGLGGDAVRTLAGVNGINEHGARALQAEAMKVWRRRSRLTWTVCVAPSVLERYPALAALSGQGGIPGQGRGRVNRADSQEAMHLPAQ